jgi:hypothetical protein
MSFSKYEFSETRYSENHTLRLTVNEILSISGLNKIRYITPRCEFYRYHFRENLWGKINVGLFSAFSSLWIKYDLVSAHAKSAA